MSHVPAKIRTTPAHRRCPNAARPAASTVSAKPTTVTWFGVSGVRPSAVMSASARRRTHASNRVVNTRHLQSAGRLRGERLARFLVDLDDLGHDGGPRIATRLADRVLGHARAEVAVTRQDDQRRGQLAPVARLDGDAV